MSVILNNESIVPFFGERLTFVKGLDPLGLQNTSDSTFSILLPGLNNVTGRIRYYSFYSWLLDAYSKVSGNTDPKVQRQFVRRAEYIVALASQYVQGDSSSIPGSNYAAQEIKVKKIRDHDLQAGTYKPDGSTRDTYWNYTSGAFGQYYLGSLRDIGIVIERDNEAGLYVRTNKKDDSFISGEELANAFGENIEESRQKLFLKCIEEGKITEKQIKQLLPDFNLANMPHGTSEPELLKKLLLQKDFPLRIEESPKTLRKQTIKHILNFLSTYQGEFYDRIFVNHCYDEQGLMQKKEDECMMGWYYYQFNEFWQYACTSILNGTLSFLEKEKGTNWIALSQLVDTVTQGVLSDLQKRKLVKSPDVKLSHILGSASNTGDEHSFFELTSDSEMLEKISNAFFLIFNLYESNKSSLSLLKSYSESNEIARDGEGVNYFMNQFRADQEKTISTFIRDFIFIHIIYRHQYVAFRKTGGGSLSTQKFIIEDQHIRYIGNFDAGYTGPRIGRLINFLQDLEILDSVAQLTDVGKEQLSTL